MTRLVALTPTYKPVGGAVKILDYVHHALDIGLDVEIYCPDPFDRESALFRNRRAAEVVDAVPFYEGFGFGIEPDDYVFISWPTHYLEVARRLSPETDPGNIIHLVQGTHHANPRWLNGFAYRLLSQPMTRIMITDQVLEATKDLVNPTSITRLIIEGHDWEFFHRARTGGLAPPIQVAYTTWKSKVGDRVAAELEDDDTFVFRRVSGETDWQTLRELYHWCDVFLASPRPQEGLYLPGLEALAAGAILVTPDVEGNRAYCDFDKNCLEVAYDSVDDYVKALRSLVNDRTASIERIRDNGYAVLPKFDLKLEGRKFGDLLAELQGGV